MDVLPAPIAPVPDPWPVSGLVLRTPRLELRPEDDASHREFVRMLHAGGIHPAKEMPFSVPWTDADPRHLGRGVVQHFWSSRARCSPESWTLQFLVRAGGALIGLQDLSADRFGVLREVRTGSYLGRPFQGRGYGVEMRAAVLAFAFDRLGARSARLGYRPDGTTVTVVRDRRVVEHRLLLVRDAFVRPGPAPEVTGYTPELADFLAAVRPRGDPEAAR